MERAISALCLLGCVMVVSGDFSGGAVTQITDHIERNLEAHVFDRPMPQHAFVVKLSEDECKREVNGQIPANNIPDSFYNAINNELYFNLRNAMEKNETYFGDRIFLAAFHDKKGTDLRDHAEYRLLLTAEEEQASPVRGAQGQQASQVQGAQRQNVSPMQKTKGQNVSPVQKTKGQNASPVQKTKGQNVSPVQKTKGQNVSPVQGAQKQKVSKMEDFLNREPKAHCVIFFSLISPCAGRCIKPNGQYSILKRLQQHFGHLQDKAFVYKFVYTNDVNSWDGNLRDGVLQAWKDLNEKMPLYRCYNPKGYYECRKCINDKGLNPFCTAAIQEQ